MPTNQFPQDRALCELSCAFDIRRRNRERAAHHIGRKSPNHALRTYVFDSDVLVQEPPIGCNTRPQEVRVEGDVDARERDGCLPPL